MSQADVDALRWLYEQFASGNFWAGREVFDPEIEWEWSSSMMDVVGGRTYRGLEGVEEATRDWFQAWDWFWTEAEEFIPVNDEVVVFVRRHGRPKGGTLDLESRTADVWTMRNGKAIRYKAYDDRRQALDAVGLPDEDRSL